ncbi:MAG: hypothetical protein IKI15_04535 [Lachnospiraceae bacterium]|nr:hypothetical protein [Lachnospiraceae bacterium]
MKKTFVTLVVVAALIVGSLQMSTGTAKAASGISVSGFGIGNAPMNASDQYQLLRGRSYDVLGTVAGNNIVSVEVEVFKQGYNYNYFPYAFIMPDALHQYTSIKLVNSRINTNVHFGELPLGDYIMRLTVYQTDGVAKKDVKFKVQDEPIISLDGFKNTLTYGKGYGIPGYVASNVPIKKINVTVYFRNGDNPANWSVATYRQGYAYSGVVCAERYYPSGNYWPYSGTALDNNIHFAGLMRGPYALIVTVYPTSGPTVSKTVDFTVK